MTDSKNNIGTIAPIGNLYTNEAFPFIMASYHMSISAGSGGTQLPNIFCGKIELQNLSGNHVMWWGGNPPHAPYSGRGNEIPPMVATNGAPNPMGEKIIYVNNANQISICSSFSGEMISFIAYGNGQNTVIDPATQGSQPDNIPPLLSGTTPVSGAIGLYNQSAVWTFSEAMDPNTMTISGLYVVTSGQTSPSTMGHLGGTITYVAGATTAIFTPNSGQYLLNNWYIPMADAQTLTAVDDADGNPISGSPTLTAVSGAPFQIQAAPGISTWAPASGAINQAFNQAVVVTFISGTMDPATVNTSGLYIVISGQASPTTTGHLSGAVTYSSGATTATITVNSGQYALSGWYIPFAAPTMADFAGAQIGSTVSGSPFQIIGPPIVSGWFPVSGATGASGLITIAPQFSTKMLGSTINTSGLFVVISGQATPLTAGHFSGTVSINSSDNTLGQLSMNSGQLAVSTWYVPFVTSGCTDAFGNNVTATISGAPFQTAASFPGDTTPPVVSGSTPLSGATGINTSGVQTLIFSKPMLSGTIVNASFVLRDTSSPANVSMQTVSLQSDLVTVTMTPTAGLTVNHGFAFNISGATDLNSNNMTPFSGAPFKTEAALVVSGTSPVSGATNVDIGVTITNTVSKAYQSGTVTTTTVRLRDIQGVDTAVAGSINMVNTSTIQFAPTSLLALSHLHRIELSGIKDLDGNFMTPFSGATFTTQAPVTFSVKPASGATNVGLTQTISGLFSRAVNSVTTNVVVVTDGSGNTQAGAVSLNSNNLNVTFAPTGLAYNSVYTYEISGVQDLALESFMTPFSGATFTTTSPALTQFFNATSSNSSTDNSTKLYAGNSIRVGEKANTNASTLIPRKIKQAQYALKRVGNPSGGDNTVYCRVRDINGAIQTTLGSIPATSLTTSFTAVTFTNLAATFAIATGTRINVEFSGGDSSNYVQTLRNGNQPAGQSNVTFYAYYDSSEHTQPNTDVGACIFWY